MRKIVTYLLTSLCFLFSATSEAKIGNAFCEDFGMTPCCDDQQNNYYAEIFGGANFIQSNRRSHVKSSFKTGYTIAASIGYKWCYGIRWEAEYAFRRNQVKNIHFFGRSFGSNGHYQSSSYMANLFWDIPLKCWGLDAYGLRPFIGGGIGWDYQILRARRHHTTFRDSKKHFAWQGMAGLTLPLYFHTDLSLEYRYHQGGLTYLHNHTVGVGVKYNFPAFF